MRSLISIILLASLITGYSDWTRGQNNIFEGADRCKSFRTRLLNNYIDGKSSIDLTSKVKINTQSSTEKKSEPSRVVANSTIHTSQKYNSIISGNVREEWVQRYESNNLSSVDLSNAIVVDDEGNVIVTGISFTSYTGADYLTVKYNERGEMQWSKRYNGDANGYDESIGIVSDKSGNTYVVGFSALNQKKYNIVTVKYNSAGDIEWIKKYLSNNDSIAIPTAVEIDNSGNILIGGYSESTLSGINMLTLKYNSNGELIWSKNYDGMQHGIDLVFAITVDSVGNVLVGGSSQNSENGTDMIMILYDSTGGFRWEDKLYQSSSNRDAVTSVSFDSEGNAYATGYHAGLSSNYDYCTMKDDKNGVRQWLVSYDGEGNGNDYAYEMKIDQDDNIYVTGTSYGGISKFDYTTISYDKNGNLKWSESYKGSAGYDDQPVSLVIDRSHRNIFVTGSSNSNNGGPADYATLCYNYSGSLTWKTFYGAISSADDCPTAMAIDEKGNVYVTGSSNSSSSSYDFLTAKYISIESNQWPTRFNTGNGSNIISNLAKDSNGDVVVAGNDSSKIILVKFDSTGKLIWNRSFGNEKSKATGLTLDKDGNIHVTGYSYYSGSYDYITLKYNIDGTLLWSASYNGTGNLDDRSAEIATDNSQNVYVTGTSYGNESLSDIVTIKYNSDGLEQWSARYNGSYNSRDSATGLVVDSIGNVYTAGTTVRSGSSYDFVVIKYLTDGIESWKSFYNGPANGADFLNAITTDNKEYIFVTGRSNGVRTYGDYTTLKISYSGAVKWIARYNGPANSIDDPSSLDIDSEGNVVVTGLTFSPQTGYDIATIKYDSSGVQLWSRIYNGDDNGNDFASDIQIDVEGNIYIAATSSQLTSMDDIVTIRYSPVGYYDWLSRYNSLYNMNDKATSLLLESNGKYIYTSGVSFGLDKYQDIIIIKSTFSGASDQLWPRRENGPGVSYDNVKMLKITPQNDVAIVGRSLTSGGTDGYFLCSYKQTGDQNWNVIQQNLSGGDINISDMSFDQSGRLNLAGTNYNRYSPSDITVLQHNSDGILSWQQQVIGGFENSYEFGSSITVDANSNVIVAGYSSGTTSYDYVTLKFDSTGNLLWKNIYDGESNKDDLAYDVAVDKIGDIYVTGLSTGSSTRSDYATVKYSSEGEQKWAIRWNGEINGEDRPVAIAVDEESNIYVCGFSTGSDTSYDIVVAKYDSSSNLLFTNSYHGENRTEQMPKAMGLDYQNNLIIVGQTRLQGSNHYDYLILKYDPSGRLIWEYLYDGQSGLDDIPAALALDANGGIYVTGKSMGDDFNFDFTTIKINSFGNIEWIARYGSVSGCNNEPKSIAIDSSNAVYVTGTSSTNDWSIVSTIKYSQIIDAVPDPVVDEPIKYDLSQNYPNPFNSRTTIRFSLPKRDRIKLQIFNMLGQLVLTIINGEKSAGIHKVDFDSCNLTTGLYFYRLQSAGGYIASKKMMIIK
ncbi:MAG: SBBP repeat-containing protein [Ignavibacteriales bacterium]|nr:SBBP repeat-containing protein [Ignavibacteriales bacterium]